ncbi:hypothetical protein O1L60_27355 [Streptomyces diastatochromogenes]|nr:hypothetical protein [Streptomyces diastatochromogenes]
MSHPYSSAPPRRGGCARPVRWPPPPPPCSRWPDRPARARPPRTRRHRRRPHRLRPALRRRRRGLPRVLSYTDRASGARLLGSTAPVTQVVLNGTAHAVQAEGAPVLTAASAAYTSPSPTCPASRSTPS